MSLQKNSETKKAICILSVRDQIFLKDPSPHLEPASMPVHFQAGPLGEE